MSCIKFSRSEVSLIFTRLSADHLWRLVSQETVEMSEPLNSQSEALDEPVVEPVAKAAASPTEEAMVLSHIHDITFTCLKWYLLTLASPPLA